MLKYVTLLAPYLLKVPHRNPAKRLAGFAFVYGLMALGAVFVFTGSFIWSVSHYGYEVSFIFAGLFLLGLSGLFWIILNWPKRIKPAAFENELNNDPIGSLLPESAKQDPIVQSLLKQVNEYPLVSSLAGVTVGIILAKTFFEES
ncbi:hypothetical protein DES40_2212 [Litorimonas taeanensis]|uniref:Uncharacterized protein n=1 Tax=Litorimonas taeanensis TaxID=568099 RepID=A0A420WEM6_9PROT|nr:hypothetical protein [Litorimonas taeanensis]RKQ69412.1 hypothetical protein DES40_2212 [Litorimonas taeanensis]